MTNAPDLLAGGVPSWGVLVDAEHDDARSSVRIEPHPVRIEIRGAKAVVPFDVDVSARRHPPERGDQFANRCHVITPSAVATSVRTARTPSSG